MKMVSNKKHAEDGLFFWRMTRTREHVVYTRRVYFSDSEHINVIAVRLKIARRKLIDAIKD